MPKKTTATKPAAAKRTTKSAKKTSTTGRASAKTSPRAKSKVKAAGDEEVTVDRRRTARREGKQLVEKPANLERRAKVQRRRQIDPTTCERDYSDHEIEFMNALDEYKRTSGRMFPTCSEVLEVIRGLGYVKLSASELAVFRPVQEPEATEGELAESMDDEIPHEFAADAEELELVSAE